MISELVALMHYPLLQSPVLKSSMSSLSTLFHHASPYRYRAHESSMTSLSTLFHLHASPHPKMPAFSISCSSSSSSFNPRTPKLSSTTPPPARDRVIDFGKYKGRMLGTLPPSYLKWVSKNLLAPDDLHWAKLADQVLDDAVYRDRIEWEQAQNALTGDNVRNSSADGSAAEELIKISQRFGWDFDDKVGWSKVNFELLGTSKGGRIPRKTRQTEINEQRRVSEAAEAIKVEGLEGDRRRERRLRMVKKKEEEDKMGILEKVGGRFKNGGLLAGSSKKENEDEDNWTVDHSKKFPGREALLKKAYSKRFM